MQDPQLAWYIGGPVVGLCVVAMRWLLNQRLGATGAWSGVVERATGRSNTLGTRGWLLIGLVLGGAVFALANGGPAFHDYGWLTRTFDSTALIAAILFAAGILIGFGAKTAGGCTSGNGLCGTAVLSPAALVSTATFFGTAIVVSFVIKALI
jgi:uncharacterized membrane protein YedE/YeeE